MVTTEEQPKRQRLDDLGASPLSPAPRLRARFWVYFTIVFVAGLSVVVTNLVGAPIWIAVVILGAVVVCVTAVEVRRLLRTVHPTPSDRAS